MIKRFFSILIILASLVTVSCKSRNADELKFYVVDRDSLSHISDESEILDVAKNNGRLAFYGDDILRYNWQTHTVTLKESAVSSYGTVTKESGGSALFKVDDTYAFVLAVGNDVIYTGGFQSGTANPSVPLQPYIKDVGDFSFDIEFDGKYSDTPDNRSNKTLYGFLSEIGILSSK